MTVRAAVATDRWGDPWDEVSVLAGRLAGALACSADVDVLVPALAEDPLDRPAPGAGELGYDGACRLLRFPAECVDRRVRAAWRRVVFGGDGDHGPGACACPVRTSSRPLPPLVEEELVLVEGGDAPGLYEHLRTTPYDLTVFVGLHSPVTYFGLRAIGDGRRVFLLPGRHDQANNLQLHTTGLAKATGILVCTEVERRRWADRVSLGSTGQVENLGFLLGINPVVRPEGTGRGEELFVVMARDWGAAGSPGLYGPWVEKLARRLPDGVGVRLVGPGATFMPHGIPHTDARIDAWWWMSRALALVDPVPHRVIGQEVLESLLLGVPVVVTDYGDATREHAEVGNGGLWYRTDDELVGSIRYLLDQEVARLLGEQGRSYAAERFGDTDTYVKRVAEVLLG